MKINNKIQSMIRVAKIELNTMFYSPVAWLLLVVFAFQTGAIYSGILDSNLHTLYIGRSLYSVTQFLFSGMGGIYDSVSQYLYLYIPLITMGLMSKEYSTGSIRLLYTSPITNSSIIMGKFLSMLVYGSALVGIIFIYILFSGMIVDNFDWPFALTGFLGIFLLLIAYASIGLFMSTLTSYQVVAAVGTLAILAILDLIKGVGQDINFVREITYWLSMSGRTDTFIRGLITSEDVIYFITVTALFIILSILKLNVERNRKSKLFIFTKYFTLFAITISVGYVSTRPSLRFYYDATSNKENTLSVESQNIMKDVVGDLKITTYVNAIDGHMYAGLPRNRNNDKKRFEKYLRFKPDIEMDYVFYYDKAHNEYLYKTYKGKTEEEMAKLICRVNNLDFDMFKSPSEMSKIMDLSSEGNKFIRFLDYTAADGAKRTVRLRLYNDIMPHPEEAQISGAMLRLVSELPKIGFITTSNNRSVDDRGVRGYYSFSKNIWYRHALVNNGFDIISIDLSKDKIAEDVNIMVIADIRDDLSDFEMDKIKRYIDKGGNMFILGENNRQSSMNKLTEYIGVSFMDGMLIQLSETRNASVIPARLTEEAVKKFPDYKFGFTYNYFASMPTATAIDYSKVEDFEVLEILKTDDKGVWVDRDSVNFVDETPTLDTEKGEVEGSYPTLIGLSREINNKEQRIIVSGDADFISNGELMTTRDFSILNSSVIKNTFRWLSDDKFPVYTRRPAKIDNDISFTTKGRKITKLLSGSLIGLILLISSIVIISRRKRK